MEAGIGREIGVCDSRCGGWGEVGQRDEFAWQVCSVDEDAGVGVGPGVGEEVVGGLPVSAHGECSHSGHVAPSCSAPPIQTRVRVRVRQSG